MTVLSWSRRILCLWCALLTTFLALGSFAASRPKVTGAQEIDPQGPYKYGAISAYDRNINSAWCTSPSQAREFWIQIDHDSIRNFSGVGILSGVAKNAVVYRNNSRPKDVVINVDGTFSSAATLLDDLSLQWIPFDKIKGRSVKVTIKSVYAGAKYKDICITEVIDDKELFLAYDQLTRVSKGASAIRAEEIGKEYREFFTTTYQTERPQGAKPVFWEAVRLRVSHRDERALRMLLDLMFFAQEGKTTIDAELLGGLRSMIVPFLQKEPKIVLRILRDSAQVSREAVAGAYSNLITNFAYDPNSGKITDPGYTEDLQEIGKLIKDLKLQPG